MKLGNLGDFKRAKRPERLSVVLTREEVQAVLAAMREEARLAASLLYGAGLRQNEVLRLRVKDVDFGYEQITVRDGKGRKDRRTMLPASSKRGLQRQLQKAKALHAEDLEDGYGAVYLPDALARKYPNAPTEWKWQYVFPAETLSTDPRGGTVRHPLPELMDRAAPEASREARRSHEAGHVPHAATLVCDASWKPGPTSAACRRCWATRTYARRWCTPVLQREVATRSPLEGLDS